MVETVQVHSQRINREDVTARPPYDADVGGDQDLPQAGEVTIQRAVAAVRKPVRPDPVGELVDRHRTVGLDQQHGQHAALARMTDIDGAPIDEYLDVAEQ